MTPDSDTASRPLRLALLQAASPASDVAAGLGMLDQALRAAGALGARMLVAPEVFLPGYNQPDIAEKAVDRDGRWVEALAASCKTANCGVCVGYAERDGTRIFNAAIALNAKGQRLADYRKIQLYGAREKAIYTPGHQYATFDLEGHKAAILICCDVEFAPHVAHLAALGVTLILVPTANMVPFDHVARVTVPAMAANHGVAIVYANYCGTEGDLTYTGGSLIAAAEGSVVAQAGRGPAMLIVDMPDIAPALLSTQAADFRPIG
jgi:5-aminopentanamidase